MPNRLRRLLVAAGILVVVFVGLKILAGRLVPTEALRRTAAEKIREATGARVELGEAKLRILPRPRLTVNGSVAGSGADLARATGSPNEIVRFEAEIEELSAELKPLALLRGRVETGPLRLACAAARLETRSGELELRGAQLEIHDVTAGVGELSPGKEAGSGPTPPGEAIPQDLAAAFRLHAAEIVWQGALYDHVEAEGELDMRVVTIDRLVAGRAGGTIEGALEVDFDRDPWGILDLDAKVQDVPAVALLQQWAPLLGRKLDCALSGGVSGGCGLRDEATVLSTLELTGRLHGDEGVLHAREWLTDVAPYLGERQDLQDIRFASLEHTFRVSQGRYRVEELVLEGPDTDWTGEGWIGLDGTIDADLAVKLPAGFTPDLGNLSFLADGLRDDEGRVNLNLHLTGRSARPDVGLKLGAGTSGRKAAEDALKKGVGGFLDKLKTR